MMMLYLLVLAIFARVTCAAGKSESAFIAKDSLHMEIDGTVGMFHHDEFHHETQKFTGVHSDFCMFMANDKERTIHELVNVHHTECSHAEKVRVKLAPHTGESRQHATFGTVKPMHLMAVTAVKGQDMDYGERPVAEQLRKASKFVTADEADKRAERRKLTRKPDHGTFTMVVMMMTFDNMPSSWHKLSTDEKDLTFGVDFTMADYQENLEHCMWNNAPFDHWRTSLNTSTYGKYMPEGEFPDTSYPTDLPGIKFYNYHIAQDFDSYKAHPGWANAREIINTNYHLEYDDLEDFDKIFYVTPPGMNCCFAQGEKQLWANYACGALAHEFGHTTGLNHGNQFIFYEDGLLADDKSYFRGRFHVQYGDYSTTMGSNRNGVFNGPERLANSWIQQKTLPTGSYSPWDYGPLGQARDNGTVHLVPVIEGTRFFTHDRTETYVLRDLNTPEELMNEGELHMIAMPNAPDHGQLYISFRGQSMGDVFEDLVNDRYKCPGGTMGCGAQGDWTNAITIHDELSGFSVRKVMQEGDVYHSGRNYNESHHTEHYDYTDEDGWTYSGGKWDMGRYGNPDAEDREVANAGVVTNRAVITVTEIIPTVTEGDGSAFDNSFNVQEWGSATVEVQYITPKDCVNVTVRAWVDLEDGLNDPNNQAGANLDKVAVYFEDEARYVFAATVGHGANEINETVCVPPGRYRPYVCHLEKWGLYQGGRPFATNLVTVDYTHKTTDKKFMRWEITGDYISDDSWGYETQDSIDLCEPHAEERGFIASPNVVRTSRPTTGPTHAPTSTPTMPTGQPSSAPTVTYKPTHMWENPVDPFEGDGWLLIEDTSFFKGTMDKYGGMAMIKIGTFWDEDATEYWTGVFGEPAGKGGWEDNGPDGTGDLPYSDRLGKACRAVAYEENDTYGPFTSLIYHGVPNGNWIGHCWASRDCTKNENCFAYDQYEYIATQNTWNKHQRGRANNIHTHVPPFGTTEWGVWHAGMEKTPVNLAMEVMLDVDYNVLLAGQNPGTNNLEARIFERAVANMTDFSTVWYDAVSKETTIKMGEEYAMRFWAPDAVPDFSVEITEFEICDEETPPNCRPWQFDWDNGETRRRTSEAETVKEIGADPTETDYAVSGRKLVSSAADLNMYDGWVNPATQAVLDSEVVTDEWITFSGINVMSGRGGIKDEDNQNVWYRFYGQADSVEHCQQLAVEMLIPLKEAAGADLEEYTAIARHPEEAGNSYWDRSCFALRAPCMRTRSCYNPDNNDDDRWIAWDNTQGIGHITIPRFPLGLEYPDSFTPPTPEPTAVPTTAAPTRDPTPAPTAVPTTAAPTARPSNAATQVRVSFILKMTAQAIGATNADQAEAMILNRLGARGNTFRDATKTSGFWWKAIYEYERSEGRFDSAMESAANFDSIWTRANGAVFKAAGPPPPTKSPTARPTKVESSFVEVQITQPMSGPGLTVELFKDPKTARLFTDSVASILEVPKDAVYIKSVTVVEDGESANRRLDGGNMVTLDIDYGVKIEVEDAQDAADDVDAVTATLTTAFTVPDEGGESPFQTILKEEATKKGGGGNNVLLDIIDEIVTETPEVDTDYGVVVVKNGPAFRGVSETFQASTGNIKSIPRKVMSQCSSKDLETGLKEKRNDLLFSVEQVDISDMSRATAHEVMDHAVALRVSSPYYIQQIMDWVGGKRDDLTIRSKDAGDRLDRLSRARGAGRAFLVMKTKVKLTSGFVYKTNVVVKPKDSLLTAKDAQKHGAYMPVPDRALNKRAKDFLVYADLPFRADEIQSVRFDFVVESPGSRRTSVGCAKFKALKQRVSGEDAE